MTQIPTESQNIHVIAGKLAGLFRFVNDKNETAKKNSTSTNRDRRLSITVPPMHHEICPLWRRLCFIILLCVVFFICEFFAVLLTRSRCFDCDADLAIWRNFSVEKNKSRILSAAYRLDMDVSKFRMGLDAEFVFENVCWFFFFAD